MTTSSDSTQPMLPGLIWSAVDSPVSRTVLPENVAQAVMSAISGEKCGESFAMLGPDGSWLKMYQGYYQARLDGTLEEFSGTWPRSGTMRAGSCYPLLPLALRTEENESLLWPTPTAHNAKEMGAPAEFRRKHHLTAEANRRTWATPTLCGNYNRKGVSKKSGDGLATQVGGPLNPTWVEWLMGFPLGWTGLDASEML